MVLSYRPGVQVSMTFKKVGAAEGSACREMTEHDGPGAKRWVAWGCGVLLACSVRGKQEELGPSVATQQKVGDLRHVSALGRVEGKGGRSLLLGPDSVPGWQGSSREPWG